MLSHDAIRPAAPPVPTGAEQEHLLWRRRLPAGLLSLLLHLAGLVLLALLIPSLAALPTEEPPRPGGIVLARSHHGEREYFSENADTRTAAEEAAPPLESALPESGGLRLDSGGALPLGENLPLPGGAGAGEAFLPTPESLVAGGGTPRGGGPEYGVEVELFGAKGYGSRFLFVFDRSKSMEGEPLAMAKQHLLTALGKLGTTHQFQIIFYNHEPLVFNPHAPAAPRMAFGTPRDLGLARDFIARVAAHGNTDHLAALRLALNLRPDCLFFLTDADEPILTAADLRTLRRLNHGSTINAVEFGFGPNRGERNHLVQLAEQNGGAHVYVNVLAPGGAAAEKP